MLLAILSALTLKHFVFDFLYQPPYQWRNKGTYGHWGGLVHTGQHMLATGVILWLFGIDLWLVYTLIMFEGVVHYHMDWAKMNLNAYMGWGPTTHNEYFVLLGFDQLVHSMTYIAIVWAIA